MNKIELECNYCKTKIYRTKQRVTKSKIEGYINVYCNTKCQNAERKEKTIKEFEIKGTIRCGICKEEKHFLEFNKNKTQTIGYQTVCKECNRKRSKQYYKENTNDHKEKVKEKNKIISKKLNDLIINYLLENPCIDCGEKDIRTLQFDHIDPNNKTNNVSDLVRNKVKEDTILKEISKCEVRCANCHSKRTSKQFNWYKQLFI